MKKLIVGLYLVGGLIGLATMAMILASCTADQTPIVPPKPHIAMPIFAPDAGLGSVMFQKIADETPAKKATKLAGWVHVVGCPHTSKAIGQNNVVLFFDDGESVAMDLNKMDDQKHADLKAFIGDIQGYTFVAKCEIAT